MKPTLEQLIRAIQASWSAETCFDPKTWTTANPARGQCVASSLVVQFYLGGDLLRYKVSGQGISEMHYCNALEDGTIIDTTGQQYKERVTLEVHPINLKGFASVREKRLADETTKDRYELLLSKVTTFLNTSTFAGRGISA